MTLRKLIFGLLALMLTANVAAAEPTYVTVRVLSKDAKFVGTSMGGVLITIRDADTGRLLAEGVTKGTTGDTRKLVMDDWERGVPLSGKGAAQFDATIDIDEPTLVEVAAFGPLAQRQSANRVTATQWVVPGKHVTGGDGWILLMPGFIVDILSPPAGIKYDGFPQDVLLKANVTLMCGCPVKPNGIWDADEYEVKARVKRNGVAEGEFELDYAGEVSQFALDMSVNRPGTYEIVVYAFDPANGNTGLDKVTFKVEK